MEYSKGLIFMGIAQQYELYAAEGEQTHLQAALQSLGEEIKTLDGCTSVMLYQDITDDRRFFMIETWESAKAHERAPFPKELLKPVIAATSQPPAVNTMMHVPL